MTNHTATLSSSTAGSNLIWIFVIWILDFLIVGLSNGILAFLILRFEALRDRKEYLIICAQCFADALNMLGYIWSAFHRLQLIYNDQFSALIPPWKCLFGPPTFLWMSAGPVASLMLVTVAVDRYISVSTPLKYLGYSADYAYRLVVLVYGFGWSMGVLGVLFLFIRNEESPRTAAPCYIGRVLLQGTYPLYAFYYLYIASAMGILSVFVYVLVGLKFLYVKHHVVHSHNQSNQGHQQAERESIRGGDQEPGFEWMLHVGVHGDSNPAGSDSQYDAVAQTGATGAVVGAATQSTLQCNYLLQATTTSEESICCCD